MKQIVKLIGTVIGLLLLFFLLINFATGRLQASLYKLTPGYWKAQEIAKTVESAYKKYQAEGKANEHTTFEDLIPYIDGARRDEQGSIDMPGEYPPATMPCKGQLKEHFPAGNKLWKTSCVQLKDNAKIFYNIRPFISPAISFKGRNITFYIDTDGENQKRENTYYYFLEGDGEVMAERDIALITQH